MPAMTLAVTFPICMTAIVAVVVVETAARDGSGGFGLDVQHSVSAHP
jgi:pantoate kinase